MNNPNSGIIEIRDEVIIETTPVQDIQWESSYSKGNSSFRAVHRGTFGDPPRHDFALQILKEDLDLQDQCNVDCWSQLNHENIVKLFWHGRFTLEKLQVNNELSVVTEYCNQGSLHDLIHQRFPTGLNAHYYKLLLECIFNSLGYLGAQNPPLLNRNILPCKMMLHTQTNRKQIFKLTGFATMCYCPDRQKKWESLDYVPGNAEVMKYWHPRVLKKFMNIDDEESNSNKQYIDVYSAGTVLYEAATGHHHIRGEFSKATMRYKLLEAYDLRENDRKILSLVYSTDTEPWIREYEFPEGILLAERPDLLPQLRDLIVKVLQVDQTRMLSFDYFLDECEKILDKHFPN